jgi:cytochrome oxidase Cu insertion factor (SCO1/SenC/PrrC family)
MKRAVCAALLVTALPFSAVNIPSAQESEQAAPDKVAKVSLKVGDAAPDFALLSDQWKTVKLSDFRGKKNVLLAVYVLAFTGG